MKFVLTEKESVAKDIARIMRAEKKNAETGFYEGNGYSIGYAQGHLVELAMPDAYGYTEWKKENLPMLPNPFKLVQKDGFSKRLKALKEAIKNSDEVICATDAGLEGELIFRYIYTLLGVQKPFKRLWAQDNTDKSIIKAFENLLPGSKFDNHYMAAKCRSESDWMIGLNGTQALTLAAGRGGAALSVGRVQTPTLAMICERYLENTNFKPENYYQVEVIADKAGSKFAALSIKKWNSEAESETIAKAVKESKLVKVIEAEKKERLEKPPLLFDLTYLQRTANKMFGFTSKKTLEVTQTLYEKKFVSYPRTDSSYINNNVYETVPGLIGMLKSCGIPMLEKAAIERIGKALSTGSVNDAKVTDHHALIVTENIPSNLSADEKTIYTLIGGRMLEAFGETCRKNVMNVKLQSAGENFEAKGSVIVIPGWRSVFGDSGEEETSALLPDVSVGENLTVGDVKNLKKQTRPKPLLNEDSLLAAMQSCGKSLDDEDLIEALKEKGIGRPSTRDTIIEDLIERKKYVFREKKSLIPTERGLQVYNVIKAEKIASAALTGEWEYKMKMISEGKGSGTDFMAGIKEYTKEITAKLLNINPDEFMTESESELPNCPKCGDGRLKFVNAKSLDALLCEKNRTDCGFIVFRTNFQKKLTDEQMVALVRDGKTEVIKGFKANSGNKFDVALKLTDDFKIQPDFADSKEPKEPSLEIGFLDRSGLPVACPCCTGGTLLWSKERVKCKGCGFSVSTEILKQKLSEDYLIELIRSGQGGQLDGFVSTKSGNKFSASLKVDAKAKKVEFVFANSKK